ncbi:hypothetical protein VTO73DRAFT_11315 [Trametes versicolor]
MNTPSLTRHRLRPPTDVAPQPATISACPARTRCPKANAQSGSPAGDRWYDARWHTPHAIGRAELNANGHPPTITRWASGGDALASAVMVHANAPVSLCQCQTGTPALAHDADTLARLLPYSSGADKHRRAGG